MCEDCKYFYKTKSTRSKTSYEALMDKYITVNAPGVMERCCGIEPMAIILDDDQPVCRHFDSKIQKRT